MLCAARAARAFGRRALLALDKFRTFSARYDHLRLQDRLNDHLQELLFDHLQDLLFDHLQDLLFDPDSTFIFRTKLCDRLRDRRKTRLSRLQHLDYHLCGFISISWFLSRCLTVKSLRWHHLHLLLTAQTFLIKHQMLSHVEVSQRSVTPLNKRLAGLLEVEEYQ